MTAFNDPWYAGIIERFSPDKDDEGGSIGRCILVASCILAQSIDTLAEKFSSPNVSDSNLEKANLVDVFDRIESSLDDIAGNVGRIMNEEATEKATCGLSVPLVKPGLVTLAPVASKKITNPLTERER